MRQSFNRSTLIQTIWINKFRVQIIGIKNTVYISISTDWNDFKSIYTILNVFPIGSEDLRLNWFDFEPIYMILNDFRMIRID